jgi:threonine/homoserine/homoserine lactone efflux protein
VLLSVGGGGYLVAVGIGALPSDQTLHLPSGSSHRRGAALWWRGLGVSALNPKSLLFFVAFLPQFARTSAPWPMTVQLGTLGAIWALLAGCFYAALGLGTQRVLALRPEVSRLVARIAGGAMVVAGGLLLADQVVR